MSEKLCDLRKNGSNGGGGGGGDAGVLLWTNSDPNICPAQDLSLGDLSQYSILRFEVFAMSNDFSTLGSVRMFIEDIDYNRSDGMVTTAIAASRRGEGLDVRYLYFTDSSRTTLHITAPGWQNHVVPYKIYGIA